MDRSYFVACWGMRLFIAGPFCLGLMALGTESAIKAASLLWIALWLMALAFGIVGRHHLPGKIAIAGPFLLGFTLWTSVPRQPAVETDQPTAAETG